MKRWLAMLLCLMLCMPCVLAEEEPIVFRKGCIHYIFLEDGTAEIVDFDNLKNTEPNLTIPDKLGGHELTSIGEDAFSFCNSLTSITLPDTLINIHGNPFDNCSKLMKIKVSLEHPTFETIDGVLFNKLDQKLVCYPGGAGMKATEYAVPEGIREIGSNAFQGCYSLRTITLPDTITSIEKEAFSFCGALRDITLPDTITNIGDRAFLDCMSLTSITLPDALTSIGGIAFENCTKLEAIQVSPEHPTLATIDGVLFNKLDKRLVRYPEGLTARKYGVPKGIREIGEYAFYGCDSLKTITLPDTITCIDAYAFCDCWDLMNITLSDKITSIGEGAFSSCYDLRKITLPDTLTSIGAEAFSGCENLTSITIPETVTSIGENAFSGCKSLTLTVTRDSYGAQYCKENNLNYSYPDSNDWLND